MVNHGITSGALFVCAGLLYERTHSREIVDNSALGKAMPVFLSFFVLFSLSAFGFPGTNSFVGEMMILVAAFKAHPLIGATAIPGAVLAAAYMLRLTQKMIWDDDDGHGHGKHDKTKGWDLNPREIVTLAFLGLFVLWIGLAPAPLLEVTQESVAHLVNQYQAGIDALPQAHHALIWSMAEFLKGLI
jgi:NADH-quinone oxidoreductase subunit M